MAGNFIFCETDKLNIKEQLDIFYKSIMERLLPSFSTLEKEAVEVEKESLNSRSKHFDPDTDDEACIVEDAYFDGVNHYLVQSQMKQLRILMMPITHSHRSRSVILIHADHFYSSLCGEIEL